MQGAIGFANPIGAIDMGAITGGVIAGPSVRAGVEKLPEVRRRLDGGYVRECRPGAVRVGPQDPDADPVVATDRAASLLEALQPGT